MNRHVICDYLRAAGMIIVFALIMLGGTLDEFLLWLLA